jgi:phosphoribosyl 1,2-cyclic phosphodiesterase
MKLKFYGARGSLATPMTLSIYRKKIKKILELYKQSGKSDIDGFINDLPINLKSIYGGNTSCSTIQDDEGNMLILDAGSGLRELGNEFKGMNNLTFHIFLSHFHWDHICGIPFFKPVYNPTNTVYFYSTSKNAYENLERQQHPVHFPVTFSNLPIKKHTVLLTENEPLFLSGFTISNIHLIHSGGSSGYIFEKNGKKISYATDTEFTDESLSGKSDYYRSYFEGSDCLILDSQYSLVEFFNKFDWGHTSSNMAVNLAYNWKIKKLVLFHFDPDHSDDDLVRILKEAREMTQNEFYKMKIEIIQAIEGGSVDI